MSDFALPCDLIQDLHREPRVRLTSQHSCHLPDKLIVTQYLTRCTQAAQNLLGENFGGVLNSDRHAAYNWVDLQRRQLCWAHLRREFIKISERPGVSAELGTALVKQQEKLFELWHRVRDGTRSAL